MTHRNTPLGSSSENSRKLNTSPDSLVLPVVLLVLVMMQTWALYHGDCTMSNVTIQTILKFGIYGCAILLLILVAKHGKITYLCSIPILYWFVVTIDSYHGVDVGNILSLALLVLFMAVSPESKHKVFCLYRNYLVLMSAVGIVCYVAYVAQLPIPYTTTVWYGENSAELGWNYISYDFSYLIAKPGFVRLAGLFNEAGYFGTFLAFVLCADKMNLRKPGNILMFLAGICTFSMAFWLIIGLYTVLLCYKRPKLMICLAIVFAFVVFVLPIIAADDANTMYMLQRLGLLGDGFEDNRSGISNALDLGFYQVLNGPDILFGYGGGFSSAHYLAFSTYKSYVIDYGIVGFSLIYVPLALAALKKAAGCPAAIFYCICFFISVYQRPNIFTVAYLVLLFGGLEFIQRDNEPLHSRVVVWMWRPINLVFSKKQQHDNFFQVSSSIRSGNHNSDVSGRQIL